MKKSIYPVLQVVGMITFLAGVVNLFVAFTDKWIMIGGLSCYLVGTLIGSSVKIVTEREEAIEEFKEKLQSRRGGFAKRLEDAREEQKRARNNSPFRNDD